MKTITKPNKAITITGEILDGNPEILWLSFDNISDIKTIIAYDYEDSTPHHDQTCVMEIHFHNYQENIEGNKLRILYNHPAELLSQLAQFMLSCEVNEDTYINSFKPDYPFVLKMDLRCGYGLDREDTDEGINKEDFDEFNCKIIHKKRFFPSNPDMPWD